MTTTYIGIGSNLSNPLQQVERGIEKLKRLSLSTFIKQSSLYLTPAMGNSMQPDFINAVVEIKTQLLPRLLLKELLEIELEQGRIRDGTRWGPRILDLDILLYGNQQLDLPLLKIPHPGLTERAFVLVPLLEIAPDICLPQGRSLLAYMPSISIAGIKRLPA